MKKKKILLFVFVLFILLFSSGYVYASFTAYVETQGSGKVDFSDDEDTLTLNIYQYWNDKDNANNTRPEKLTFYIYQSEQGNSPVMFSDYSNVTITDTNGQDITWRANGGEITVLTVDMPIIISGLPAKSSYSNAYTYAVSGEKIDDYEASIEYSWPSANEINAVITNTLVTSTIEIQKEWDDNDNAGNTRPNEIGFTVYKSSDGGQNYEQVFDFSSAIVQDSTGNDCTIDLLNGIIFAQPENMPITIVGLPIEESGNEIIYNVLEEDVTGYSTEIEKSGNKTYTLVPSGMGAMYSIYNDSTGEEYVTFGDLYDAEVPIFDSTNGNVLNYYGQGDGYHFLKSINMSFQFRNVYSNSNTGIGFIIEKIWNDKDNAFNTRPNEIEFTLYRNSEELVTDIGTATIKDKFNQDITSRFSNGMISVADTELPITFLGLPKYDDYEQEYVYYATEGAITGYYGENYSCVSLKQVVVSDDAVLNQNATILRCGELDFDLLSGERIFILPYYDSYGNENIYELLDENEIALSREYLTITDIDYQGTFIKNELKTVDVYMEKEWEDGKNISSTRPDSMEISLYNNFNKFEYWDECEIIVTDHGGTDWSNLITINNGNIIVPSECYGTQEGDFQIVVKNVPEYEGDNIITYTFEEEDVIGYKTKYYWKFKDKQEYYSLNIKKTSESQWTPLSEYISGSKKLPVYDINDQLIEYEIDDGLLSLGDVVCGTYIKNSITVNVNIEKEWNDNANELGLRPETIEMFLYKTTAQEGVIMEPYVRHNDMSNLINTSIVEDLQDVIVTNGIVELDGTTGYDKLVLYVDSFNSHYVINGLPLYDEDGNRNVYILNEPAGNNVYMTNQDYVLPQFQRLKVYNANGYYLNRSGTSEKYLITSDEWESDWLTVYDGLGNLIDYQIVDEFNNQYLQRKVFC